MTPKNYFFLLYLVFLTFTMALYAFTWKELALTENILLQIHNAIIAFVLTYFTYKS